ncbi:FAD-binding oxidoreductase [uncultured Parolsenella sp.]|uniref:FAD-binding oxidoreductase n=1 Tax=uncultured Parolsenella sp. TaxID=2083008 RepID=UPI0025938F94|nr:FAD-binding oxidoreductase [uncultured Parolsenella sp.]
MTLIKPLGPELEEYVRDESRTVGHAETISFPTSEDQVRDVLRELHASGTPVTVQGARTGLAAGAVPQGGHVLNLSRMDAVLGLRRGEDGTYHLRVQPGVVLANLRKALANKSVPTNGWDEESLAALDELYAGPEQFFPTDPTETSACIGGMVACNASGARSYGYGPVRPHVSALRVVLADGDVVALRRGEAQAHGRSLRLVTEAGRSLSLDLPTYEMPHTKNASGYYVADDMDALDLFVGSDGTLGVVTEVELALMPAPAVVWGVSCFFETEAAALDFTVAVRPALVHAAAIEYFDAGALSILRSQRENSAAFASLPAVEGRFACCVYVELDCDDEDEACAELYAIGDAMRAVGADEADTWVARTDVDRECQRFFRHAVPESVNMLIDERRRTNPAITKLGSDMSVPDERLHDVIELYRTTLAEAGLQSAAWGHIGNNHLHVNVLPRGDADFAAGKELFCSWAAEVTRMGGAVSAEHGVGKIKRGFLETMYGPEHVREMARLKRELDPAGQLGRGNLFGEELLGAMAGDAPSGAACEKGGERA